MELHMLSGLEIGNLVNSKEVSAVEVIEYFGRRIEAINPKLNAFVYTKIDEALEEAKALQKRIMSGEYVGPFAGVPVCLKDFLPSKKGWTNTHGGVKSLTAVDDEDSQFYKAARELGCIAIGKTNSPHFGFRGTCDNKLYGPTRNPFDLSKNSGGSSGGTAAAVAAGLVPFGEGGDAGGSIRIPAAWCNCFGFKASPSTIDSFHGKPGLGLVHPYCTNGAITRTVDDSVTIFECMSGGSIGIYDMGLSSFVRDLKVAVTLDFGLYQTDPEIRKVVTTFANYLSSCGAKVDFVDMNFQYTLNQFAHMWCTSLSVGTSLDIDKWKEEGLDFHGELKGELSGSFLRYDELARNSRPSDFMHWSEMLNDIRNQFSHVMRTHDIILAPVTSCNPVDNASDGDTLGPKTSVDGYMTNPVIGFAETFLVNFLSCAAASVPAGFTKSGLPIGLQLIGGDGHAIIRLAKFLENSHPWSYDDIVV